MKSIRSCTGPGPAHRGEKLFALVSKGVEMKEEERKQQADAVLILRWVELELAFGLVQLRRDS